MRPSKVQIQCSQCGGWHYLIELNQFIGTIDISYFCPKFGHPSMKYVRQSIAFERIGKRDTKGENQ